MLFSQKNSSVEGAIMAANDVTSRRSFIQSTMVGTAGVVVLGQPTDIVAKEEARMRGLIGPGDVVLFQGDSITDAGRSREQAGGANQQVAMGTGYAWIAASSLLTSRAEDDLQVFNRGISGNKVPQLADRWQEDCFDLKPDVLSILIGVNDLWHRLNGDYQGTVNSYEMDYRELLERTKDKMPDVKLVLCEPFLLNCGAVDDSWFAEFDLFRAVVRRMSAEFDTAFVPFQSMFDQATSFAPPDHWAADGVHPTSHGAALMAHHWLQAVSG